MTDLEAALSGNPDALDVHFTLIERDVAVDGQLIRIHCHCLALDGNGRVQLHRLAQFMRNAAVDYALPKSKIAEAKRSDATPSTTAPRQLLSL